MQTKKRISGRNASRQHASPKASKPQKKISEKVQDPEKKVTELITSSVRKHKIGMLLIFVTVVCNMVKKNKLYVFFLDFWRC